MPLAKYILMASVSLFLFNGSCRHKAVKESKKKGAPLKELVVYCENTMLNMVVSLKKDFELTHNCHVVIQNDCSKNLMGKINYSGKGDVYIPSSGISFKNFFNNTGYQINDSLLLGYNQLVYMVKKGNPKGYDGQLKQLKIKGDYSIIIANPQTSSLGFETKEFLEKEKAYNDILQNVVSLTADSKGLVQGIKSNQADVIINWQSNLSVNGNNEHVEVIIPKSPDNELVPVYAASLSCSSEPALAQAFLKLVSQELGESSLNKLGFTKRQTIIF